MDQTKELRREQDGGAFNIHYTGGLRADQSAKNQWMVSPFQRNDRACARGPYATSQLHRLERELGISAIAFHEINWINGEYNSHWVPILPGRSNHSNTASGAWSRIKSNLSKSRNSHFFQSAQNPSEDEIIEALDKQDPSEYFASYISFTLQSLDVSIEHIADYYYEQLVNDIAAGNVNGERSDSTRSNSLPAHVHSFFLHIGMARDYLAALVAHQLGIDQTLSNSKKTTDSMAKLVERVRRSNLKENAIFALLIDRGDIVSNENNDNKFQISGWLKEITDLRNELVHRRPYGSNFRERWGSTQHISGQSGFYRHSRYINRVGRAQKDLMELIVHHYCQCNYLMLCAADASGYDTSMLRINADDVISFKRQ